MTTGVKRYVFTVVLFLAAMAIKVYADREWWSEDLWRYAVSTLIIIPIVWYAGYFFRQAEEQHRKPL